MSREATPSNRRRVDGVEVGDAIAPVASMAWDPSMSTQGVGDDGHVGSLYPNRDECTDDYSWCLPVEMKDPGSISLSLPVMRAAREVLVAACGVSEKYPQGKSDAMKRAVETEESVRDFPAAGLRDVAQYVFDEAAASKLTL